MGLNQYITQVRLTYTRIYLHEIKANSSTVKCKYIENC